MLLRFDLHKAEIVRYDRFLYRYMKLTQVLERSSYDHRFQFRLFDMFSSVSPLSKWVYACNTDTIASFGPEARKVLTNSSH